MSSERPLKPWNILKSLFLAGAIVVVVTTMTIPAAVQAGIVFVSGMVLARAFPYREK